MRAWIIGLVLAFSAVVWGQSGFSPAYQQEKADPSGKWSRSETSTTPSGRKFLGEFGPGPVGLAVTGLPQHKLVKVSFDFLAIRSWDGNYPDWGPDLFNLLVDGDRTVLRTTFGMGMTQAFPGVYGVHIVPGRTGAAENNKLGYTFNGSPDDAVFHIERTFPHTGTDLKLTFLAQNDAGMDDESWGLANVTVSVAAEYLAIGDAKALLVDLGNQDPAIADRASVALASNPDLAVPALTAILQGTSAPTEAICFSPFVLVTGPQVIQMKDGPGIKDQKQRQIAMAIRTLEMIGTPEAVKVIPVLAGPPEGLQRLTVKVGDEKTGAAVPLAMIVGQSGGFAGRSSTDAKGETIVYFPTGKQHYLGITLEAEGYMTAAQYFNERKKQDVPATLAIKAQTGITIGGVVVDDQDKPVPGATVVVAMADRSDDRSTAVGPNWVPVQTDAQGRWTMSGVPERRVRGSIGVYHLQYVSTYSNDAGFFNMSEVKDYPALQDKTYKTVLKRGVKIAGQVIGKDGKPLAGAGIGMGTDRVASNALPEEKTDKDGRFSLGVHPEGEVTLTINAAGYAPEMLKARPGDENIKVEMKEAQVVRGKIVDPAGAPLSGAYIWVETWRGCRTINATLRSDAKGEFVWDSAPADGAQADIEAPGYVRLRSYLLTPGKGLVITVSKPSKIDGEVVDAETGKPITTFSVVPGIMFEGRPDALWQRDSTKDYKAVADGKFDVKFGFPYPGHKIRVEADGYLPQESERFTLSGGDKHFVFKMQKGKPLTGVVLTPDGEPAGQVRAYLLTPGTNLQIQNGEVPEYSRREILWVKTADDGRFTFPPQTGEVGVLLLHPFGIAEVTGEQLAKSEQVKLEAWGEAKGVVMVGTKPAAGAKAIANSFNDGSSARSMGVYCSAEAKTDADGTFSIKWLRPGRWQFSRDVQRGNSHFYASSGTMVVKPGETANVKIGGIGRPVTGKLVMPKELEGRTDWVMDILSVTTDLKYPQRKSNPPTGLSREAQQKWYEEYQKSDEGKAFMDEMTKFNESQRHFSAPLDKATGRFRADDVVAGKYRMRAMVYKTVNQYRHGNEPILAMVNYAITVPEIPGGVSDEPLDVGEVPMTYLPPSQVGDVAPAFDAKTIDGRPIKLADYAGKIVLLVVWIPAEEEADSTDEIKDLLKKHPNLVVIGVPQAMVEPMKELVKQRQITWPQVAPAAQDAISLTMLYAARGYPDWIVIGKDGKIAARPLLADVAGAVDKAMKQ